VTYAFYPGCSLEATAWDFAKSTKALFGALGVEIAEIDDWVCCGSTPAHSTSESLAVALPVMNLQKAQALGLPILTACASCYARLRVANYKVRNDPKERERAERVTGKPYDGSVDVHHILEALAHHLDPDTLRAKIARPLDGLKVACYYGCLLNRPPEMVNFEEHPEHPRSMDALIEIAGGEPVDWPYRTECCGASLAITNTDVVNRLGHRILAMAREAGAECIAVACPLCQMNLDLRQADSAKAHGALPPTPVPYITQLLGIALGLSPDALGMKALTVSADSLLAGVPS